MTNKHVVCRRRHQLFRGTSTAIGQLTRRTCCDVIGGGVQLAISGVDNTQVRVAHAERAESACIQSQPNTLLSVLNHSRYLPSKPVIFYEILLYDGSRSEYMMVTVNSFLTFVGSESALSVARYVFFLLGICWLCNLID